MLARSSPAPPGSRRTFLRAALAAGVGTVTGMFAYGYGYERNTVSITRERIQLPGWPAPLDGLRIALLTDFHRSETVTRDHIEHAVDVALGERPDLIVLGGDYVTWGDREYVQDAAESLGRLSAPQGVFAVLGNHDDDRDMPAALAKRGFTVLKDARTRLSVRGERLDLVGIRYWTRRRQDIGRLRSADREVPALLLAHDPRRLHDAAALGMPLVLAGHTHGGQVVFPGLGALAARKFPVLAGIGHEAETTIFVSRGIGTVYIPVRLNCAPEVALLTLTGRDQTT